MDAKSRAEFINSVAAGEKIICSHCNTYNPSDNKTCFSCGQELNTQSNTNNESKQPETPNIPEKSIKYIEPEHVFAQGLPEWSIEPPQVMVRRR